MKDVFIGVRGQVVIGILVAAICYFPLFHHLDRLSIRQWDESRLAVSAMEMIQSGNLIVTSFEQEPDMWNTKPPLMIWLQAVSMKVFGYNELGVRMPAALAGLGTVMFLFLFFLRRMKRIDIAIITVLALVSCAGYTTVHVSRTGDYDALLAFFLTVLVFLTYQWLEDKKLSTLAWMGAVVVGACWTKGIQGLVMLPGLVLFIVSMKKVKWVVTQRNFWSVVLLAWVAILSYYGLREMLNPGYMASLWETELGGLYGRKSGFHAQPFSFYMEELSKNYFVYWKYFLPLGLLFGFISKDSAIRKLTGLLTLASVTYLLIISSSQTKLWWYETPALPLFSALIGIGLAEVFYKILSWLRIKNPTLKSILFILFIGGIVAFPYTQKIIEIHNPQEKDRMNWRTHKVGECWQQLDIPNQINVVKQKYNAQAVFYVTAAQMKGIDAQTVEPEKLPIDELALICVDADRQAVDALFETQLIQSCVKCEIVKILSSKVVE